MGFRFQKRIKILPGVSVNLSKSGISTSVGVKGARVTMGNGKTRTTVGLPGTGLSHTTVQSNTQPAVKNEWRLLKGLGYVIASIMLVTFVITLFI